LPRLLPFGLNNRAKLEIESVDAIIRDCKYCARQFKVDRLKGNKGYTCNSCRANRRRIEVKEKLVQYKGGCCVVCGYSKCNPCLSFHHLDPSQKDFGIGGMHCFSLDRLKLEVDKCVLLCLNCHGELHAGLINIPL
jgi:hypothetical protein